MVDRCAYGARIGTTRGVIDIDGPCIATGAGSGDEGGARGEAATSSTSTAPGSGEATRDASLNAVTEGVCVSSADAELVSTQLSAKGGRTSKRPTGESAFEGACTTSIDPVEPKRASMLAAASCTATSSSAWLAATDALSSPSIDARGTRDTLKSRGVGSPARACTLGFLTRRRASVVAACKVDHSGNAVSGVGDCCSICAALASEATSSESHASKTLGSDPLGPKPLGSEPLGSKPLGSKPLGSEPRGSEPLGSEPPGAEPSTTLASSSL
mmetsp:Transcript_9706/g.25075  ORF Transcript_9706/g.25075 Transcript_9706/m.25075 type:complete len:271 (-) Transcript_9706:928-1740(-)